MTTHVIRAIAFMSDGVSVEYATPATDVRSNGLLLQHMLFIPNNDQYADQLDKTLDAVNELLEHATTDFAALPPVVDEEDIDAPGPYDNPNDLPPGQD